MVDLEFLKEIELFKGLDDDRLLSVQACCSEVEFNQGEKLFSEKQDASCLWIVRQGSVDLRFELPGGRIADGNTVSSITEKMIIGWSSFVPPYKYTLSAYCSSRTCRVVKIETECLKQLFDENPRVGYLVLSYLIQVIGSRFLQMQHSTMMTPYTKTRLVVHMGTCGIAAGAREVMSALLDEIDRAGRKDIKLVSAGCIGTCSNEPNVTVEIGGENPVVYKNMNPEKARRVFQTHVMRGEVQSEWAQ